MATITVKKLLDDIALILQDNSTDEDERAWPASELVGYYNREVRALAAKSPDAVTRTESVKLASGFRQYIPSEGITLIAVLMNMGTDGNTPGTVVSMCNLAELQVSDQAWNQATAEEEILNAAADPGDDRSFYTYPPSDGSGQVLLEYAIVPTEVVWDDDDDWFNAVVEIQEKYIKQLENRILARCYKKDTDIPGNLARENDNQQEAMS